MEIIIRKLIREFNEPESLKDAFYKTFSTLKNGILIEVNTFNLKYSFKHYKISMDYKCVFANLLVENQGKHDIQMSEIILLLNDTSLSIAPIVKIVFLTADNNYFQVITENKKWDLTGWPYPWLAPINSEHILYANSKIRGHVLFDFSTYQNDPITKTAISFKLKAL